ncbi:hypothetical protein ACMTN4_07525 [Rhodococcus globerulus]|uniref:hypothetical protein n=1 Tax=Rhodococcus globerulus TaxID=33008 RepID=UPI0039EB83B2
MAFVERTDWVNSPKPPPKPGETPVRAADIKRWERGIAAAHEELEGRLSEEGIDERVRAVGDGTYVRFVDQNGDPLPDGAVTTIHVNTTNGGIDDITFEGI